MGNVYFADYVNNRIRKIDTAGIIYTVAGNGTGGYTMDGIAATASEIYHPYGVFVDKYASIFIGDQGNSRVRKIAAGIITTIAGNGTPGYAGDGMPATAALFNSIDRVAVDAQGNVFIADAENNRVRRIDTAGIITTVAGIGPAGGFGSYTGDGIPATAAGLYYPSDVATDGLGNLFIADHENYRIRRVDVSGVITTYAGSGLPGTLGDGSPATACEFEYAAGIALDAIGNLYIADENANRVRKVNTAGIINTIAGTGVAGFFGDGGPATAAKLNAPSNVAVDAYGNVYISDITNERIREIKSGNHLPAFTGGHVQTLAICEDAGDISLDSLLAISDADTGQPETWTLLSGPFHGTAVVSFSAPSTGGVVYPSGLYYHPAAGYAGGDTLTVRVDDGYSVYVTTIYVSVASLPHAGTITGADSLCAGWSVSLSDTASGGVWHASNGSASVSSGTVSGIFSGVDTIFYVVSNACGSDTAGLVDTIHWCPDEVRMPTGNQGGEPQIYPNPNSGCFYLYIPSGNTEQAWVTITNIIGEKVKETVVETNGSGIMQLDAPSGVYFIKIGTASHKYMCKVVVE